MNQQPDQLSKLLLEADGLLLLLHRHREETPIDAIKLLRKKLQLILALTEGLDELIEDSENNIDRSTPDNRDIIVTDTDTITTHSTTEYNVTGIDIPQTSEEADDNETSADTYNADACEYIEDTIESPEPTIVQSTDPEQTVEPEPVFTTDPDTPTTHEIANYMEEIVEDPTPTNNAPQFINETSTPYFMDEKDQAQVLFMDEVPVDAFVDDTPLPEPDQEVPSYHRTYIINESAPAKESYTPRRPISSVFNLNDKFRFRRELFGNSDAQYVECLDMLSAMKSLDEAKEYLFEDLNWDPDNDDAKAFIELLTNYYQ